ncbi:thioesterase family protein [Actinospongicola halichondriae]|uniref:thioesterase family protein n=1 Tax=Actinospongicola halichondriae TaxID=3236844 RepID=UPI003D4072F9
MPLQTGLTASIELLVADEDTAQSFSTGIVPVLATPRLVALCEEAAVAAIEGALETGSTSVGQRVQFDHLAPTMVGAPVTAEATLEKISGRRLTFTVSASDPRGLIGAGKVTRVVVDVERFLDKAR